MTRTISKLALGGSLAILALSTVALAGRGGGRGGMQGGGGGGRGAAAGGGGGFSGGDRGAGGPGGGMSHSPSFSQPRHSSGGGSSGARNPYADGGGSRDEGSGANRSRTGTSNRNQTSNAGAAAAGAGMADRNQPSTAGAAAAGAGAANRNQPQCTDAGAAAAGAGKANRNQPQHPDAGAAAAGASYANNQDSRSNAGAAVAGASYANRNQYDQYHPGMSLGSWNGNYGASSLGAYGGVAAWGAGTPAYNYGYSSYSNPYTAGMVGGGGVAQPVNTSAPAAAPSYDYSQPLNTAAQAHEPDVAGGAGALVGQARQSFQARDYDAALQAVQQALARTPDDNALHEFLALILFAQGGYEQAAAPLYAVLSIGPGWDWTTLIGYYADSSAYTEQIRRLEAFSRANPRSARAQFVLAYHYITQGHTDAAIKTLDIVVALQPDDTLSAQLRNKLRPPASSTSEPAALVDPGKPTGTWTAQAPNATITLTFGDSGAYEWAVAAPGKPPLSIKGTASVAGDVLTLRSDQANAGTLTGTLAWHDDHHFGFRAIGAPADDPGLKFAR